MRFGTEYKVFSEMIEIRKMKACFVFCLSNVVTVRRSSQMRCEIYWSSKQKITHKVFS
jgi:hypothetical protein